MVWRHERKLWRWLVAGLPPVVGVLLLVAFLHSRDSDVSPDYSDLLQGGGPYTPMVVFRLCATWCNGEALERLLRR